MIEILENIAIPRPNGSAAFFQTATYIKNWLQERGIVFATHQFTMQPYINEIIGLLILLAALSWFYFLLRKKFLISMVILVLLGGVLWAEFSLGVPLVSRINQQTAENIEVLIPAENPQHQIIFSAHYDSKTQIFDHYHRDWVLKLMIPMIALGILIALWRILYQIVSKKPSHFIRNLHYFLSAGAIIYYLILALTFGGGFLAEPSPGAIDNATSVAVLMELAQELKDFQLINTEVKIVFFAAEEINLQGSQAYIKDKKYSEQLPVYNINLEMIAQEGAYVYWPDDGLFTHRYFTSEALNDLLGQAVYDIIGQEIIAKPPTFTNISDAGMFLHAGIEATTLGNAGPKGEEGRFFHTAKDNLERVIPHRLTESVLILKQVLMIVDQQPQLL